MAKLMLKNVRLSFPNLFKRASFQGEEGKFEATFLLPKSDTKAYDKIIMEIENALIAAKVKIPKDKWFIKDGDDIEYDGYEGCWAIKASNNQRPLLIDSDKSQLSEDDGKLYAGSYVNAQIDIWIMNNSWGKRVLANVYGVQHSKDGEQFGMKTTSDVDDFDAFDED